MQTIGEIMKKNVDAADVVLDASIDPNTFDMISLSRICPPEKRLSVTLLYSPVEVGRSLAKILTERGGKTIYITGNGAKSLAEFEITEADTSEWLQSVLREAGKTNKIEKLISDGALGVGSAVIQAANNMNIPIAS